MAATLHSATTRALALRLIRADGCAPPLALPNEADLCRELGVSRTVVRESVKVLADKGMLEVRPRTGTRARPRGEWNLLDPDILAWRAEARPDAAFLRDLCEVRLAIEPTAAGFAALRATPEEIAAIARCLDRRAAGPARESIDLDLEFHSAVVAACHNPLLMELSGAIRQPFRTALALTSRAPGAAELGLEAHRALLAAIERRDPLAARSAADRIVGLAMLAVEAVIRRKSARHRRPS